MRFSVATTALLALNSAPLAQGAKHTVVGDIGSIVGSLFSLVTDITTLNIQVCIYFEAFKWATNIYCSIY
jgi:hypothetical protein